MDFPLDVLWGEESPIKAGNDAAMADSGTGLANARMVIP